MINTKSESLTETPPAVPNPETVGAGEPSPRFYELAKQANFDGSEIASFLKICDGENGGSREARVDWAAKVTEAKEVILNQATKGALWTAQDVGEALVNATTLGVPKSWNALARSLGENGLDLPYRKFGSKRYFLLACIGATSEEKASKQELMTALPLKAFKILFVTRGEKNTPELS